MTSEKSRQRRGYTRSTEKQRDEAVQLVSEAMHSEAMTRNHAAELVAESLGFSRSAVIGWCEDAGVLAAPSTRVQRRLVQELRTSQMINQRLSAQLAQRWE